MNMADFKEWLSSVNKEKLMWVGIVLIVLLLLLMITR